MGKPKDKRILVHARKLPGARPYRDRICSAGFGAPRFRGGDGVAELKPEQSLQPLSSLQVSPSANAGPTNPNATPLTIRAIRRFFIGFPPFFAIITNYFIFSCGRSLGQVLLARVFYKASLGTAQRVAPVGRGMNLIFLLTIRIYCDRIIHHRTIRIDDPSPDRGPGAKSVAVDRAKSMLARPVGALLNLSQRETSIVLRKCR